MPKSQSQIIIKNATRKQIMVFFIDYYSEGKSLFNPLCILCSVVDHATLTDPMENALYEWRIAQISERENDASSKLADITFAEYPIGLVVFFEYDDSFRNNIEPIIVNMRNRLSGLGYKLVNPRSSKGDYPARIVRGPTKRIQDRAMDIKRIKDSHPEWSKIRVAEEYNRIMETEIEKGGKRLEDNKFVNENTVKNDYNAMGWKWERSDRIR